MIATTVEAPYRMDPTTRDHLIAWVARDFDESRAVETAMRIAKYLDSKTQDAAESIVANGWPEVLRRAESRGF